MSSVGAALRTGAYLLLTRLSAERRMALRHRPGRTPLRSGALTIATGLGGGLRLPAEAFPLEHVHAHHLLRGTLEQPVQEALRRHVGPGAVVYDVGANVGFFTMLAARLTGADGRVHAFEPVPASAAGIRAAAALNGLTNVAVHELAIGARAERAAMSLPEDSSWAFLERYAPDRSASARLEVEVVAIDALVREGRVEPPSVVKVDVEGGEVDVLSGMQETIARSRPVLIAEMHGRTGEFVDHAASLGYRVTSLDGPEPPEETGPNVHVIAVPAESDAD